MEDNIQLRLLGITYNQIESGVYALILEDPVEGRRLPIVIGYPEAQSIECHLQNVRTPRPLTHDLLANLLQSLGARLVRVDIHRLVSGPYAGKLTIEDQYGERRELDSRSSDAIALAIRVGAPIYASRTLMKTKGYIPQNSQPSSSAGAISPAPAEHSSNWESYTDGQLQEMILKYVSEENYEMAAEVKQELERRKNSKE